MKIELKTSFLFGLLIGLLLVLLFGKPRKAAKPAEKPNDQPAAKPESARSQTPPASLRNRPGGRTTAKTTIDVEAEKPTGDSEFDKETARLDAEAFGPFNDFMSARREQKVGQSS